MKGSDWSVVYFYLVIVAVIVDFERTKRLLVFLVSVFFSGEMDLYYYY